MLAGIFEKISIATVIPVNGLSDWIEYFIGKSVDESKYRIGT